MRLPNRVLRWTTIALLLGANCANAFARVYMNSEAPIQMVVNDALAGRDRAGSVRTYVQMGWTGPGHPGEFWINSPVAKYDLALDGAVRLTPEQFRDSRFGVPHLLRLREKVTPWMIALDAKVAPQVDRIITWERQKTPLPEEDRVLSALGAGWVLKEEQSFHPYGHWMWNATGFIRRREYVRMGPAATTKPTHLNGGKSKHSKAK